MHFDTKNLKKCVLILDKAFKLALETRIESNRVNNPDSMDGDTDAFFSQHERFGDEQSAVIVGRVMDNYKWNFKRFFTAAANPQVDLYTGLGKLKAEPKIYEPRSKSHTKLKIPKAIIKDHAQLALKKFESFILDLED